MKRFCLGNQYSHLNVLTLHPLSGGCSQGLDAFIFIFEHDMRLVAIQRKMHGKVCSCGTSMALAKGQHTGRFSLTLSASLQIVAMCFYLIFYL